MNKNRSAVIALAALLATAFALPAQAQMCAPAQPCGDVNNSQDVTVADALSVLRRSIDLPAEMTCTCGGDGNVVAGLLETGQTNCWPRNDYTPPVPLAPCAGTGEDGEYLHGASLDYVDNGDGTITDNNTGLMWEKLYNDNSVHHDYNNYAYLWEGAFKKADDLNAGNFAGHSDWRVPNIRELDSINIFNRLGLTVDPAFGTLCAIGNEAPIECKEDQLEPCSCTFDRDYWSSTTSEKTGTSQNTAWTINFRTGDRTTSPKSEYNYVRVVRGDN